MFSLSSVLSSSLLPFSTLSILHDVKAQAHPSSSVRFHPHEPLFVLRPRIVRRPRFTLFAFLCCSSFSLSVSLSLFLSLSLYLLYTSTPQPPWISPLHPCDQSHSTTSVRAGQSHTSAYHSGFFNHFYDNAGIAGARARAQYCTETQQYTLCTPVRASYAKSRARVSSTCTQACVQIV